MTNRDRLTSLTKGAVVSISVVAASLLMTAAGMALAGLPKELTILVVVAAIAIAAGLAAIATIDE
jgi:hypothetical protein